MKTINNQLSIYKMALALMTLIFAVISCSKDDNFSDNVPDYTQSIIQSFKVGTKFADINHTIGTITMTLPSGTDLKNVTPEIRLPESATVTPASGSTIDFSAGPVTFEVVSTNGAHRTYTVSLAAYGDPKILSFSIAGKTGVINETNNTIAVEIGSQDGNLNNLAPSFVIAGGTTVDVASGVARNFTSPVVYTVLSNNGYTAKQYTVTVTQISAPAITGFSVNGVNGIIDNSTNTILVVLPPSANLTSISPTITIPSGQSVNPTSGIAQNFSIGSVNYTVTNSEKLTKTYSVTIQSITPTKVAFIGNATTIGAISEPDTKAAALWTETHYGSLFKYISIANLTPAELADVKVVFFYYDNTDSSELPDGGAIPSAKVSVLADFVKSGRNMFMAGLANTYIDDMGRIPYNPNVLGAGAGGPNSDYWGLNNSAGKPTNVTTHPIFAGITSTSVKNSIGETFSWTFIPLIDNGYKEDHNAVWDLGPIADLTLQHCSVSRGAEFEALTHCTILGDWQFIPDMCVVAAAEWHPTGVWQGKIISVGAASYEWEMNDGRTNQFQKNVTKLTQNAIDYLLQ
ncbi:DUF4960 domain-containing protein [Flavobacterium luteum]|uniref:DUF4960 domain-containing protein n=1 Tax=Flavobacterium luteum TaxID=2026654 RepID=A0A7J5AH73_9FLAO|nr:DUF4960 domain-containing protein [Flavobacterium luteum]KAB1156944.1 DUF4960 domain-containing protein [Flavobacterium luteum]